MSRGWKGVPIELREPTTGEVWSVLRSGVEVVKVSTKASKKPRTSSKTHESVEAARKDVEKAVAKQYKAGFWPTDGHLPAQFVDTFDYVDGMENDRGVTGELFYFTVPGSVDRENHEGVVTKKSSLKLSNELPDCLRALLRPEHGITFFDGPGFSALLPQTGAIFRDGVVSPTEPALTGGLREFGFWKHGHPQRPDGAAMLVAHNATLYELTIADGRYRQIGGTGEMPDQGLHTYQYHGDGNRALHWFGKELYCLDLDTGVSRSVHPPDGRFIAVAPLHNRNVAVQTPTTLRVLHGESFEILEEFAWAGAQAMGTLDEGRLLVVGRQTSSSNDRHGISVYAVHDRLIEITRNSLGLQAAFDCRGRHYLQLDRCAMQVLGTRLAWERARPS